MVYAGTHDNDTIQGWMANTPQKSVSFAKEYPRLPGQDRRDQSDQRKPDGGRLPGNEK